MSLKVNIFNTSAVFGCLICTILEESDLQAGVSVKSWFKKSAEIKHPKEVSF